MRGCFGLSRSCSASARRCNHAKSRISSRVLPHGKRSQSLHCGHASCAADKSDLQGARKYGRNISSAKVVPIDDLSERCTSADIADPAGPNKCKDVQFPNGASSKQRTPVETAADACEKPDPYETKCCQKAVAAAAANYQAGRPIDLNEKPEMQMSGKRTTLREAAAASAFAEFCSTSSQLDPPACAIPKPAVPCQSLPPSPSYFVARQCHRRKTSKGRVLSTSMRARAKRRACTFQCNEDTLPESGRTPTRKRSWPQKSFEAPAMNIGEVSLPPMPSTDEFFKSQLMPTVEELRQDLLSKISLPLVEKKHIFMVLCRRWHPDKNPGEEMQATKLFQKLQEVKSWFLEARTS
mmetsp:Transcript_2391/g.3572  ORF Transcript_2391/g.3572 Transcript_2391/m.3572 type:complete len:352 (+) Transcript_2391:58-1113(+)